VSFRVYPNPTAVGRLLVKKRSISRCSPVNLKSWGEGGGDDLVTVDVGERKPRLAHRGELADADDVGRRGLARQLGVGREVVALERSHDAGGAYPGERSSARKEAASNRGRFSPFRVRRCYHRTGTWLPAVIKPLSTV